MGGGAIVDGSQSCKNSKCPSFFLMENTKGLRGSAVSLLFATVLHGYDICHFFPTLTGALC